MWRGSTAGTRDAGTEYLSEHGMQLSRNLTGLCDTRDEKMGHGTIYTD